MGAQLTFLMVQITSDQLRTAKLKTTSLYPYAVSTSPEPV